MATKGEASLEYVMTITTVESTHETRQLQDLSVEARRVLEIIFFCSIGGVIGVLGSAVSVINIVVFVKQGFSDSVSISLCALAVADLGFILPMIAVSIYSNPLFQALDLTIDIVDMHHITGGVFISCCLRTASWITAFTTFERCVCIALPLKVKTIITPKRTLISVVAMYVVIFAADLPYLSYVYLAPSLNAKTNRTIIGFKYSSTSFQIISNSFSTFTQLSSFVIVIICTVILVLKLRAKSKRNNKVIFASDASDSISTRDKRVMKMVTFLSSIFIAFHFPSVVNLILIICLSPEYSVIGVYGNWYIVSWGIINAILGIEITVTIFVYYNMSSKFRVTFNGIFYTDTNSLIEI